MAAIARSPSGPKSSDNQPRELAELTVSAKIFLLGLRSFVVEELLKTKQARSRDTALNKAGELIKLARYLQTVDKIKYDHDRETAAGEAASKRKFANESPQFRNTLTARALCASPDEVNQYLNWVLKHREQDDVERSTSRLRTLLAFAAERGWRPEIYANDIQNPNRTMLDWSDFPPYALWRGEMVARAESKGSGMAFVANASSFVSQFIEFVRKQSNISVVPSYERQVWEQLCAGKAPAKFIFKSKTQPSSLCAVLIEDGPSLFERYFAQSEFRSNLSTESRRSCVRGFYSAIERALGKHADSEKFSELKVRSDLASAKLPLFEEYLSSKEYSELSKKVIRKDLRHFLKFVCEKRKLEFDAEMEGPPAKAKRVETQKKFTGPISRCILKDGLDLLETYRVELQKAHKDDRRAGSRLFYAARAALIWAAANSFSTVPEEKISACGYDGEIVRRERPEPPVPQPRGRPQKDHSEHKPRVKGRAKIKVNVTSEIKVRTAKLDRKLIPPPSTGLKKASVKREAPPTATKPAKATVPVSSSTIVAAQPGVIETLAADPSLTVGLGDLLALPPHYFSREKQLVSIGKGEGLVKHKLSPKSARLIGEQIERVLSCRDFKRPVTTAFVSRSGDPYLHFNLNRGEIELSDDLIKLGWNLIGSIVRQSHADPLPNQKPVNVAKAAGLIFSDIKFDSKLVVLRDDKNRITNTIKMTPKLISLMRDYLQALRISIPGHLDSTNRDQRVFLLPDKSPLSDFLSQ